MLVYKQMEVVSYHNWSELVYIRQLGIRRFGTNWRYCIAEMTYIFGGCNKASDNMWTSPWVPVPNTYIGKKMTWFTCAPVLPCCLCTETNGAETALGLRYGDCRFLPNANCGEKIWVRGKKGGSVGFPETRHFFFWPYWLVCLTASDLTDSYLWLISSISHTFLLAASILSGIFRVSQRLIFPMEISLNFFPIWAKKKIRKSILKVFN